jgi:hypothetical protein
MARKKVAILFEIDTSDKENSSGTTRLDDKGFGMVPGADETYLVRVNDSFHPGTEGKPNKAAMLDAAAHELGHVLSSVFKVKGGMHEDPRSRLEFQGMHGMDEIEEHATPDQCGRLWANENIAWQIAEKIRPELNQADKQMCLDTYNWARDKVQNKA